MAYPKVFSTARDLRLFAPYISDPREALEASWYEMRSGEEVRVTTKDLRGEIVAGLVAVKSYGDVAREYVAHPEAKFAAPDGGACLRKTTGPLSRRHVTGERAEYIGKEGNLLHRRGEGSGLAGEVQAVYEDPEDFRRTVVPRLAALPRASTAHAAGTSERALSSILSGRSRPRPRLQGELARIAREASDRTFHLTREV